MAKQEDVTLDRQAAHDVPKLRRCLRCREVFPSAWSGERICGRCKKTKEWRTGDLGAVQSVSPRGGGR